MLERLLTYTYSNQMQCHPADAMLNASMPSPPMQCYAKAIRTNGREKSSSSDNAPCPITHAALCKNEWTRRNSSLTGRGNDSKEKRDRRIDIRHRTRNRTPQPTDSATPPTIVTLTASDLRRDVAHQRRWRAISVLGNIDEVRLLVNGEIVASGLRALAKTVPHGRLLDALASSSHDGVDEGVPLVPAFVLRYGREAEIRGRRPAVLALMLDVRCPDRRARGIAGEFVAEVVQMVIDPVGPVGLGGAEADGCVAHLHVGAVTAVAGEEAASRAVGDVVVVGFSAGLGAGDEADASFAIWESVGFAVYGFLAEIVGAAFAVGGQGGGQRQRGESCDCGEGLHFEGL